MEKICPTCNKNFLTKRRKFCKKQCYSVWQSKNGKYFDLKQWRIDNPEKYRASEKKRLKTIRGNPSWCKGKKLPYDTWNKGKKLPQFSGNKHPRWKGGGWIFWRKQALIRDNHTCRDCGLHDLEIMDVDHIEPIKCSIQKRREIERMGDIQLHGIDNLQTLCPNCHKRKTLKQIKSPGHLKSR